MQLSESNPIEVLRSTISEEQLEAATRTLTVSDAIRLGGQVTTQTCGYGAGEYACALSAARIGATVAGYIQ